MDLKIIGGVLGTILVAAGLSNRKGGGSTLTWAGGTYTVSPSDRIWLLRAVQAESNKADDRRRVAQTLVNRFIYLKARGSTTYPTLTKFVRAYAQPINPLWESQSTSKCRQYPSRCTDRMIAKRREARTRTQFDDSTREAVDWALTRGMAGFDASAVHYAAPGVGASGKIKLTTDRQGYNTFYAVDSSRRWPGYGVA
jgi:hypothetical protein